MIHFFENLLETLFYCLWELFKHPRMLLRRQFLWKSYRKGVIPFRNIKVYSPDNERIFADFLLNNWFGRPSLKSMDKDIESIVKLKTALYNAIRFKTIDEESYNLISSGLKESGTHAWELNISLLEQMTKYFDGFKSIVIKMLDDSSGRVRETALIVMGDGEFSLDDKRNFYIKMLKDGNKKVRDRAIDMIFRENQQFNDDAKPYLQDCYSHETDSDIKQALEFVINYEKKR